MRRRAPSACCENLWLLLVAVLLPGCASRSLVDRIQEDAREELRAIISKPGTEPLVTVVYGPEWQTIDIIDRRIIDGTLRCVVYSGAAFDIPAALAEPTTWYETKGAKPIETYRRIRRQLGSGDDVGREPGFSSNPVIKMHLLDKSGGGVLLEDPWSTRGIYRLASQTILSEAVLGEIDDSSHVDIQEWVDPFEAASFDVRNGLFEFELARPIDGSDS